MGYDLIWAKQAPRKAQFGVVRWNTVQEAGWWLREKYLLTLSRVSSPPVWPLIAQSPSYEYVHVKNQQPRSILFLFKAFPPKLHYCRVVEDKNFRIKIRCIRSSEDVELMWLNNSHQSFQSFLRILERCSYRQQSRSLVLVRIGTCLWGRHGGYKEMQSWQESWQESPSNHLEGLRISDPKQWEKLGGSNARNSILHFQNFPCEDIAFSS